MPFNGFALRRTLDSGGLLPVCQLIGLYDWYLDAEDEMLALLDEGLDGTFEIVQVRLPGRW